uniref:Uncharacterized protein n=1 Tax=Arundo donax TaxID=35708 RepID=A0A0A9FF27_ARUDO
MIYIHILKKLTVKIYCL